MASSRNMVLRTTTIITLALLGGACSKQPPAPASTASGASATSADVPAGAPTPAAMAAHASTAAAPGAVEVAGEATVTGKVLETMDSGGYTYVQLDTPRGKIWAATAPIKVAVGQLLTVPLEMPMQNFHSNTLKRDFPLIYFASRVSHGNEPLPPRPAMPTAEQKAAAGMSATAPAMGGQAPQGQMPPGHPGAPAAQGQMPPGHPPVGAGNSPVKVTEAIKAPAGGHAIADVWAKRTALGGKTVTVRGKVVKFLAGIMGKNWVHLQDGSGDAKAGTNDLTVTTDADAKVGDVITATGTLAVDKDFGAGYKYGAIVEGATLK